MELFGSVRKNKFYLLLFATSDLCVTFSGLNMLGILLNQEIVLKSACFQKVDCLG